MAGDFQELRRDISSFFLALRHGIDRPYRPISRGGAENREQFTRSMLLVEEARIRFNSYVRFREEPTPEEWKEARAGLLKFIDTFLDSKDIDPAIYDRPFRVNVPSSQRDRLSPFLLRLAEDVVNIGQALFALKGYIGDTYISTSYQTSLNFDDLEKVVPRQQVAPVRFEIIGEKVFVSNRSPKTLEEDLDNIRSALEHIKGSGRNLIESLEQSNCDRRLLDSVRELHSQISNDGNIVRIGLTNLACGVMCSQFQQEIPDAINAMFNSYNSSISMYVAQFPEWEQFTQRAASIDLNDEEISEIDITAGEVITALEANPDLADPEVPETIKLVREFMARPGNSAKRAAFAMMRTIENLVSSIVRYSVSALNKTADKTVDRVSTAASIVIASLLGIALVGATGIGPAAAQAGAPWVQQAASVVLQQIEKLNAS